MALAKYFDKAAMAAAQIVRGFDHAAFSSFLNANTVGVVFDAAATESYEGIVALDLTVNLLARLYPKLALVATGAASEQFLRLASAAQSVNPSIEIHDDLDGVQTCIALGSQRLGRSYPCVYVGSSGWTAELSLAEPVPFGRTANPFGAAAAACLGVSRVFRMLFGQHLPEANPEPHLCLSLLDFQTHGERPLEVEVQQVDLDETVLVGLGAIGNGAVWTLARAPGVAGVLHLVDPENIDLGNLQRYVLATEANVGCPKIDLATEHLSGSCLDVRAHACSWGEFLAQRGDWNLPYVAVAVDSGEARCAIQAALPRRIVNAWTQGSEVGLSRHAFAGDDACLMCLYMPTTNVPSDDEIVAAALGIGDAVPEVRKLLYTRQPVGLDLVRRVAAAQNLSEGTLDDFQHEEIRSFYDRAVCGGLLLRLGANARTGQQTDVPTAFQSALAGVLLAAEIVLDAEEARESTLPPITRFDVLRPFGTVLSFPCRKHHTGRCICQDTDYTRVYERKYHGV